MIKTGQTSRARSKKYIKNDKAIRSAFEKFDQTHDVLYILTFVAYQATDMHPIEHYENYYD